MRHLVGVLCVAVLEGLSDVDDRVDAGDDAAIAADAKAACRSASRVLAFE